VLEVTGLHVHYGNVAAVNGITLSVAAGEIVAVIGPNGAGKTSTLRAIFGLVRPSAGRVIFNGSDISGWKAHRVVGLGLSRAPEGRRLFPHMTVLENLKMGAYLRENGAALERTLGEVVARFPRLAERRSQRAGTLSGGEQQMLAIGRALMRNPFVLLLDEPSEGLAPKLVTEVGDALVRLRESGLSLLLVEQNLALATRVAQRVYVMNKGTIVFSGTTAELAAAGDVEARYLGI